MGNNNSIETDAELLPKKIHVCYSNEKYKDKNHVFVNRDPHFLYHIDSNIIPDRIYYKYEDDYIMGYTETLENTEDLYFIQDGNEMIDFKNIKKSCYKDNIADVLKISYEFVKDVNSIEIRQPPDDFNGTFREYIRYLYKDETFIDNMEGYYLPVWPSKESILNVKTIENYGKKWKEVSYDNFKFPSETFYLIHNTNNIEKIFEDKYYSLYLSPFKYPEYIMKKESLFKLLEKDFDNGDIGIIFNTEELFRNYSTNIEIDESYDYDKEISISDYFRLPREITLNNIKLRSDILKAIRIDFKYSELRFIYETFSDDNFSLNDILDIYLENKHNHWFIRKSNLMKVFELFKENTFPPIIATKPSKYYNMEVNNYGTKFDIDSDPELMD